MLKRVDSAIEGGALENANQVGSVVDEDLYELVVECNVMGADIENEISVIHGFVRDKYRPRFPELESLVINPLDYARVVIAIGNQEDMTLVRRHVKNVPPPPPPPPPFPPPPRLP